MMVTENGTWHTNRGDKERHEHSVFPWTVSKLGTLSREGHQLLSNFAHHLYIRRRSLLFRDQSQHVQFKHLNPELNPICYLLALLGVHHFLHVSRIRVKLLTLRLLMSYIFFF